MQGTKLTFRSKEDAIHFSEKQGESFIIVEVSNVDSVWYCCQVGITMCKLQVIYHDIVYLHLFQPTGNSQEDTPEELCGELRV